MSNTIKVNSLVNEVMKSDEKLKFWEDSKNSGVLSLTTPQQKGELGVRIVKTLLEEKGHVVEKISDQGDLRIDGEHSEVKYATVTLGTNGQEQLWWNQIRPKQEKWTSLQLVGMYPDHVKVWSFTRQQYFNTLKQIDKLVTPGHTTGNQKSTDLEQVKFVKNSNRDEFAKVKQFLIHSS
jgi:hypothetical protein